MSTAGFEGPSSHDDDIRAITVRQSDGGILIVGSARGTSPENSASTYTAVARYGADGRPDLSFGERGQLVLWDLPDFSPRAVAIQPDGRILVAGSNSRASQFTVFRLESDGSRDLSFGIDGLASLSISPSALALEADGQIVVTGTTGMFSSGNINDWNFAAVRLNADGSLDTAFGTGGMTTADFGVQDGGTGVAVQSDGRLVFAVHLYSNGYGTDFAAIRLDADGRFDSTFGVNGRVTVDVSGYDATRGITIQSDGGLLLYGTVAQTTWGGEYGVIRLNIAGQLDTTFGNAGKTIIDVDGVTRVATLVLQNDGRLLLSGSTGGPSIGEYRIGAIRLNGDGLLDESFAASGIALYDQAATTGGAVLPALQVDGKIVLAAPVRGPHTDDILLIRLDADGILDPSFGMDGATRTDFFATVPLDDYLASFVRLDDGRIVAVGNGIGGSGPQLPEVAVFHADGTPDTSFGDNGQAAFLELIGFSVRRVADLPDGGLILVGSVETSGQADAAAVRLKPDGSLDTAFGNGGLAAIDFGGRAAYAKDVVVDSDGRIILVGGTLDAALDDVFFAARLNADGSPDTTYGVGGLATVNLTAWDDMAYAVALQEDGRIVLAGQAGGDWGNYRFAAARLNADGSLDASFGDLGRVLIDVAAYGDYANDIAIRGDGRIVLAGRAQFASGDWSTDATAVALTAEGRLDMSFGVDGIATFDFGQAFNSAFGVAVTADDKTILFGNDVLRLLPDGSLDPAFADTGRLQQFGNGLVQPDGRIVLGGTGLAGSDLSHFDFRLTRLAPASIITIDEGTVNVLAGQIASNSGTVRDAVPGETVITASIGTVILADDGSWHWTYAAGDPGRTEAVTITAVTGGIESQATFQLVITIAPTAVPDYVRVGEEATASGNVLANDSDSDGHPLHVLAVNGDSMMVGSAITLVSGAILTLNADGSFVYDPGAAYNWLSAGATATDSFTYVIADGHGGMAETTVFITIDGANDGPVAQSDTANVNEDDFVVIMVLENDVDGDAGDQLRILSVDQSNLRGSVTIGVDGTLRYEPGDAFQSLGAGETAAESFPYVLTDDRGGISAATVAVTIHGTNDAPLAQNDMVTTVRNASVVGNVLDNDADPDGNSLLVTAVNGESALVGHRIMLASGAYLSLGADGIFMYEPGKAFRRLRKGEWATDSFAYTVDDGHGGSATAIVTVTIYGPGGPFTSLKTAIPEKMAASSLIADASRPATRPLKSVNDRAEFERFWTTLTDDEEFAAKLFTSI